MKFSDYIKVALRRQRGLSVLKSRDEYCLQDKPVSIGKGCSPSRVASEACLPCSEHNACLKMESSSQAIESTQVQYNPCRPTWLLDLSHITVAGPCHTYTVQLMQAQWTKGGIANLRTQLIKRKQQHNDKRRIIGDNSVRIRNRRKEKLNGLYY